VASERHRLAVHAIGRAVDHGFLGLGALACTRSRLDDGSVTVLNGTASASHAALPDSASQLHLLRAPV
jgi:hypothetical protein